MNKPNALCRALIGVCCLHGVAWAAPAEVSVRVEPANNPLRDNIQAYIGSVEGRDAAGLQRLRPATERQAEQAAQALGYYHAQIETRVEPGETPRLVVEVRPGEPVKLRDVDIRIEGPARQLRAFQRPLPAGLRPGQPLNQGLYEDAKALIESQAQRYGFFRGTFTQHQLRIDPATGFADIALVFDSGPRFVLGKVSFEGDAPFDPDLLERMVPFAKGTPYDSELIADFQSNLLASGFFDGARLDTYPKAEGAAEVPVTVTLRTRKPRTFGFGPGYSTDVGPRLRFTWENHWLNPQGHSLGAEAELSAPRQSISTWYDIPGQDPINDKFRFAGGYQYEQIADDDSLSQLLTVGPEWHRKFPNGWERVLSLKWRNENYRLGNDEGTSNLVMPGVDFSLLRSDNRIDPNRGYRLQFGVSAAKEGLLSDANMIHATALARGLVTVGDGHRFLGRLQLGGNLTNGYNKIPPSLRFFAGGDQSVRGYDYQTLSPENDEGDYVGGRYLVAGSLEYQYPLRDKWRLATFIDQGSAFNDLNNYELKTSVGVGVRWVSPVGPIRVDLAHGLDEPGGIRLHFSIGPEL
ncbi:autotransporter assembly complex family protein [Pseudomonas sp. No.117]